MQARNRALTRNRIGQDVILDFLASRTVRNKVLLFKPPRLSYVVIAALANQYRFWHREWAPGPPKYMFFSCAKYIHSIPTALKVLTHCSILSKTYNFI